MSLSEVPLQTLGERMTMNSTKLEGRQNGYRIYFKLNPRYPREFHRLWAGR